MKQLCCSAVAAFILGTIFAYMIEVPGLWIKSGNTSELFMEMVIVGQTIETSPEDGGQFALATDFDGERVQPPMRGTYRWYHPHESWAAPALRWRARLDRAAKMNPTLSARKSKTLEEVRYTPEIEAEFMTMVYENQFPRSCKDRLLIVSSEPLHGLAWTVMQHIDMLWLALYMNWTLVPAAKGRPYRGCPGENFGCFFNVTSCLPTLPQGESRKADIEEALLEKVTDWTEPAPCTALFNTTYVEELKKGRRAYNGGHRGFVHRCYEMLMWQNQLLDRWAGNGWLSRSTGENVTGRSSLTDIEAQFFFNSLAVRFMMTPTEPVKQAAREIVQAFQWEPPVIAVKIRRTDHHMEDYFAFQCQQRYRPVSVYFNTMKAQEVLQGYKWKSAMLMTDSKSAEQEFLHQATLQTISLNGTVANRTVPTIIYDSREKSPVQQLEKGGGWGEQGVPVYEVNLNYAAELWIIGEIAEFVVGMSGSNGGRLLWNLMGANQRTVQNVGTGPLFSAVDGTSWAFYNCCP